MKNMTWRELKELVEKRLAEAGADENIEIEYFDFSHPDMSQEYTVPTVHVDKEANRLAVS